MMKRRCSVVVIAATILLAGCAAKGTSTENARGPQAPNVSPVADSNARPNTGIDDIAGTGLQVVFGEPITPAQLSEDDAIAMAVQHLGALPSGSPLTVEYKLLTDANNESRPVYVVTYHNLPPSPATGQGPSNVPSGSVPSPAQAQTMRLSVLIDANSGDYLYAVKR